VLDFVGAALGAARNAVQARADFIETGPGTISALTRVGDALWLALRNDRNRSWDAPVDMLRPAGSVQI